MSVESALRSVESIKDEKQVPPTEVYYQHGVESDIYEDGTVDPVYQAKARLLNRAIQEIGMGKYQVGAQSILPCISGLICVQLLVAAFRCRRVRLVCVRRSSLIVNQVV